MSPFALHGKVSCSYSCILAEWRARNGRVCAELNSSHMQWLGEDLTPNYSGDAP